MNIMHGRLSPSAPLLRMPTSTLSAIRQATTRPWTCLRCTASTQRSRGLNTRSAQRQYGYKRYFVSTALRRNGPELGKSTRHEPTNLPSDAQGLRWQISHRTSRIMDRVLASASVAGQHINAYTGTDYSGIEALRGQIQSQELTVRSRHKRVDESRKRHHDAHERQAAAQKEIVGLLERKSSWAPSDLERYMSLVRSEHTLEQAVHMAKEEVATVERELESARALLEKLERKQYHEEQVWSDTIRRNSTWVTFGLMGVNILLLLAQIAIFEPYRRKKIVREIRSTLDEREGILTSKLSDGQSEDSLDHDSTTKGSRLPSLQEPEVFVEDVSPAGSEIVGLTLQDTRISGEQPGADLATGRFLDPKSWSVIPRTAMAYFQDLFSHRLIQIKRVDLIVTALQGAASGVAVTTLFVVFWRR